MRILFLTDSLGGPRDIPSEIRLDDTWSHKVSMDIGSSYNIEPIYLFCNGLETRQMRRNVESRYKLYDPDLIVLQIGIVDCAPRVLSQVEVSVISRMGFFGKLVHEIISKNYPLLSRMRDMAYVNISEFEENLRLLKESFRDIRIITVAIAKPCKEYKLKSPLIEERYELYNSILREIFGDDFVDPYAKLTTDELDKIFLSDNHHINPIGHSLVADEVIKHMKENIFVKE